MKRLLIVFLVALSLANANEWRENWADDSNLKNPLKVEYSRANRVNLNIEEFIHRGMNYFRTSPEANTYTTYLIMRPFEKYDKNLDTAETITKRLGDSINSMAGSSEVAGDVYRQDNYSTSGFFVGGVDTTFGVAGGISVKRGTRIQNGTVYETVEIDRLNFPHMLKKAHREYCAIEANKDKVFTVLYDQTIAMLMGMASSDGSVPSVNPDHIGVFGVPCRVGGSPFDFDFNNVHVNLSRKGYEGFVPQFTDYPRGFNRGDLKNDASPLFAEGGTILNLSTTHTNSIKELSAAFFTSYMHDRGIGDGFVVQTANMDGGQKHFHWTTCAVKCFRKCCLKKHWFRHKAYLGMDHSTFNITPLSRDTPFTEWAATMQGGLTNAFSSFSPINVIPTKYDLVYYVSPDKHIQSHSVVEGNPYEDNLHNFSGVPANMLKTHGRPVTFINSDTKSRKDWVSFFVLVIAVALVATGIGAVGLGAGGFGTGALGSAFTSAWGGLATTLGTMFPGMYTAGAALAILSTVTASVVVLPLLKTPNSYGLRKITPNGPASVVRSGVTVETHPSVLNSVDSSFYSGLADGKKTAMTSLGTYYIISPVGWEKIKSSKMYVLKSNTKQDVVTLYREGGALQNVANLFTFYGKTFHEGELYKGKKKKFHTYTRTDSCGYTDGIFGENIRHTLWHRSPQGTKATFNDAAIKECFKDEIIGVSNHRWLPWHTEDRLLFYGKIYFGGGKL